MANTIHPTAILEGEITLGDGNVIGPYAVLQGHITMGDNNIIDAHAVITNEVVLGNGNRMYPFVSIGALGEMGRKGDRLSDNGRVIIGHGNTFREMTTIHAPVHSQETRIGDRVYIMNKGYVAHDNVIGDGCVLSAGVKLGGQVVLEEEVTIGLGAAVHQRIRVGAYAMIGMLTPITTDILPYTTVAGNPARIIGFNRAGAQRKGIDAIWMDEMEACLKFDVSMIETSENLIMTELQAFLRHHPQSLVQVRSNP